MDVHQTDHSIRNGVARAGEFRRKPQQLDRLTLLVDADGAFSEGVDWPGPLLIRRLNVRLRRWLIGGRRGRLFLQFSLSRQRAGLDRFADAFEMRSQLSCEVARVDSSRVRDASPSETEQTALPFVEPGSVLQQRNRDHLDVGGSRRGTQTCRQGRFVAGQHQRGEKNHVGNASFEDGERRVARVDQHEVDSGQTANRAANRVSLCEVWLDGENQRHGWHVVYRRDRRDSCLLSAGFTGRPDTQFRNRRLVPWCVGVSL